MWLARLIFALFVVQVISACTNTGVGFSPIQGGSQNCDFDYCPPIDPDLPNEAVAQALSIGTLTKNMACVMCHTRVTGDVSGFGTMIFREDSSGSILGNIYAADQKLQRWHAPGGTFVLDPSLIDTVSDPQLIASVLPELVSSNLTAAMSVNPGEAHNVFSAITFEAGGGLYSMTSTDAAKRTEAEKHLVRNPFTGRPVIHESDFPRLDLAQCLPVANGKITTAAGQVLQSPWAGNLIVTNGEHVSQVNPAALYNQYDPTCPASKTLTISGEILIQGDLVISGCIKGQGSIYATGTIYVPDDLKTVRSAFPYPETVDQAVLEADANAKSGHDIVGLGAAKFIIIGATRMAVLAHEEQDPIFRNNQAAIENIYTWLTPAGAAANLSLFERAFLKTAFYGGAPGPVSLVEANLYANLGVGATLTGAQNTNLVINGSVLTPNLSMLVTGFAHAHYNSNAQSISVNPFNGKSFDSSEINQDYRLKYTKLAYNCHRNSRPTAPTPTPVPTAPPGGPAVD
ncbi:MAG: hypothetical protein ABL958_11135 [Bdellovibrionia bacterium]